MTNTRSRKTGKPTGRTVETKTEGKRQTVARVQSLDEARERKGKPVKTPRHCWEEFVVRKWTLNLEKREE